MIQGCDLLSVSHPVVDHVVEQHVALSQAIFDAWKGCDPACSRELTSYKLLIGSRVQGISRSEMVQDPWCSSFHGAWLRR